MRMRVSASSAANGSSSSSNCGSRTRARASATRCASPPDSVDGQAFSRCANPTSSNAWRARSRGWAIFMPSVTLRQARFHGIRRGS